MSPKKPARTELPDSLPLTKALGENSSPTIHQYVAAASEYISTAPLITPGQRKAAQICLSDGLARVLRDELRIRVPEASPAAGERNVAGGLRVSRLDLTEYHALDGLRLAVEIKPVHLAVGRAFWNRFGDIRAAAVNVHLKSPFAVVGGLLTVPTIEWSDGEAKSTLPLVQRGAERLIRAGSRLTESDAGHLMEGVGLVVFDPTTGEMADDIPGPGSGLRWDEFATSLSTAYAARFL